jgi:uroporphyrinogen-III synthase
MDLPASPAVVLTREADDNASLAAALRERGVRVVEIPCVSTRFVAPPLPTERLDAVLFTSRRGVQGILRHPLGRSLLDGRKGAASPLLGAVGNATAAALEAAGWHPDLVAEPPDGHTLGREIVGRLAPGSKVAVVRGNLTTGELEQALTAAGIQALPVVVYENVAPDVPHLEEFPVAAVFVASPSAAGRLLEANAWMAGCPFATIGETTCKAVRRLGIANTRIIGTELEHHVGELARAAADAAVKERP